MASLYTAPLGATHASRTPNERAMRLLYMQANRNRYSNPEQLQRVAAAAESQGIDVSGSLTAESQDYTRRALAEESRQAERLMRLPMESARDRLRQDMRTAAAAGMPLSQYRNKAIGLGARPGVFDRVAADWQKRYKSLTQPKETPPNPAGTTAAAGTRIPYFATAAADIPKPSYFNPFF